MKLITPSRISRRLGGRFFFKAERDATPKSAEVRRPYPPGAQGKKSRRGSSEFGAELAEKQKIRYLYGLSDSALKRYVRMSQRTKAKTQVLSELLERRLDNVVFRLGLALSRRIARQVVSHGHIAVNGRTVRIASSLVASGDRISVREASRGLALFSGLPLRLKKHQAPDWLLITSTDGSGEVKRMPREEDNPTPHNVSKVIEYYSR